MNLNQHINFDAESKRAFGVFQRFFFLVSVAFVFLFFSCQTTKLPTPPQDICDVATQKELEPKKSLLPTKIEWQQTSSLVQYAKIKSKELYATFHLVKIQLNDVQKKQTIKLVAYPTSNQDATEDFFKPLKTKDFAKQNNCTVAINTTQFSKVSKGLIKPVGVHKVNGLQVSLPVNRYAALAFSVNKEDSSDYKYLSATVIQTQTAQECAKYDFIFGGFFAILCNGKEQEFKVESFDSRTAVGIDSTGTTLYILVAEGERQAESKGLSYQQCAKIFKELNCTDALEFDGGGATELCINAKSVLSYSPPRSQICSLGFVIE